MIARRSGEGGAARLDEIVRAVIDRESGIERIARPRASVVGQIPGAPARGIGQGSRVIPVLGLGPGRGAPRVGSERKRPVRGGVQVVERIVVGGDELTALKREVQGAARRDRGDSRPAVTDVVGVVRNGKTACERHAVPAVVVAQRPDAAVSVGIGEAGAGIGPGGRGSGAGAERKRTGRGVQIVERVVVEGDEFAAFQREVQGAARRDRGHGGTVVAEIVRAVCDRKTRREGHAAPTAVIGEIPDPAVPVGIGENVPVPRPRGRRSFARPERERPGGGVQVVDGLVDKGHQFPALEVPVGVIARRPREGGAVRLDEIVRAVRNRKRGIERITRPSPAALRQVPGAPARGIGQGPLVVGVLGLGPDGGRGRTDRERPVCRGVQVIGIVLRALFEQGVQVSGVIELPDGGVLLVVPRRNAGGGRVEVRAADRDQKPVLVELVFQSVGRDGLRVVPVVLAVEVNDRPAPGVGTLEHIVRPVVGAFVVVDRTTVIGTGGGVGVGVGLIADLCGPRDLVDPDLLRYDGTHRGRGVADHPVQPREDAVHIDRAAEARAVALAAKRGDLRTERGDKPAVRFLDATEVAVSRPRGVPADDGTVVQIDVLDHRADLDMPGKEPDVDQIRLAVAVAVVHRGIVLVQRAFPGRDRRVGAGQVDGDVTEIGILDGRFPADVAEDADVARSVGVRDDLFARGDMQVRDGQSFAVEGTDERDVGRPDGKQGAAHALLVGIVFHIQNGSVLPRDDLTVVPVAVEIVVLVGLRVVLVVEELVAELEIVSLVRESFQSLIQVDQVVEMNGSRNDEGILLRAGARVEITRQDASPADRRFDDVASREPRVSDRENDGGEKDQREEQKERAISLIGHGSSPPAP